MVKANRAVIVFFRSEKEVKDFMESSHYSKIENKNLGLAINGCFIKLFDDAAHGCLLF